MDTVRPQVATHFLTLVGPLFKKRGLTLRVPGAEQDEFPCSDLSRIAETEAFESLGIQFHAVYDLSHGKESQALIPKNVNDRLLIVSRLEGAGDEERVIAELWLVTDVRANPEVPGVQWSTGGHLRMEDARCPKPIVCFGIALRPALSGFVPIGRDEGWVCACELHQLLLVS